MSAAVECKLSIIIPTHRRPESLLRLLKSISRQDFDLQELEVLVVSNIPDQDTEMALSMAKLPFALSYMTVGKIGVNRARNLGLQHAKSDFCFFLDDDCELVHHNHLSRIFAIHSQLDHVSAVGGLYRLDDSANEFEQAYTNIANQWVKDTLDTDLMQTERLLGGNVAYKKSHLIQADLQFNENIVFGGAETELHDRMVEKHFDLRLSDLDVLHHVKLTKKTFFQKALRQGYGSVAYSVSPEDVEILEFMTRSPLNFLEFQYRHVFRLGQQKGRSYPSAISSSISSASMLGIELGSRMARGLSLLLSLFGVVYWQSFNAGAKSRGFFKRLGVFFFWNQVYPVYSLGKSAVIQTYWKLIAPMLSLIKKVAIQCYWQGYKWVHKVNGLLVKYRIQTYWKLIAPMLSLIKKVAIQCYWQGHKWVHKVNGLLVKYRIQAYWSVRNGYYELIKRVRTGINPNLAPYKFGVAEKPSVYLPFSKDCAASCDYCHLLKAKEADLDQANAKKLAADLSRLGYFRMTLPCNLASLNSNELVKNLDAFGGFEKEVLLNPDLFLMKDWPDKVSLMQREGIEFLLLHRPGAAFLDLYNHLKKIEAQFRILSIHSVSPHLQSLYEAVSKEDYPKIEWLSTSAVEPLQTDPKNYKKAKSIASTIRSLKKKSVEKLPRTSNIHYPFMVPSSELHGRWPEGYVAWQSPSTKSNPSVRYSIIVPVRFQNDHSQKVLRNLSLTHYPSSRFEVIFVDDGNEEALSPQIAQTFDLHCKQELQVTVIRWDRDLHDEYDDSFRAGQARNLGVKHSRGERFLFLDSDILVSPLLLETLDKELTDNMLAQFPRHMLKEESSSDFIAYDDVKMDEHIYPENYYWENFKTTENWETLENYWKYTCTYGLAVTKKTFRSVGPFRSEYIYYGFEDVDFGYRLFQKGARFKLIKSNVFHLYPDKKNSFHFDQNKRFSALSKSASIFLHRNFDLGFYMDLNHFLDRSLSSKMLQPYYYLEYKWNQITGAKHEVPKDQPNTH